MTEITDEMVERARNASHRMNRARDRDLNEQMRYTLDAALNPLAEPTFVVTEAQTKAAEAVMRDHNIRPLPRTATEAIYRAMRRLEKQAVQPMWTIDGVGGKPVPAHFHRRSTD